MSKNLVAVYSPEGKKEMHTRLNAHDLVNGAEYTWKPGVETTPAAVSPYRNTANLDPKAKAQAVIDAAGHNAQRGDSYDPEPEDTDEVLDAGAEDEADAEVADEAPAPAPTTGRGRRKAA